ncbi:MAG: hypothetical protein FWH22_06035, partial [Fibromonadales bacterium]|nr:hypothetical protein [Fibromonadales bacterium]
MSRLNKIFVILAVLAVSASAQQSGWLSRYWDGCKPSCSWSDKQQHHGGAVAKECRNNNMRFNPTSDANSSSCDGGTSYTCWDMAPWAASATLSYGFVAS